jgi:biopolymer transport protein ExbD
MIFTKKARKGSAEVNASSMADIAFLLLIFFLVTTTIASDKGLTMRLPPFLPNDIPVAQVKERNVFNILVNSQNNLLVEEENAQVNNLSARIKEFITNPLQKENLSENPEKAVVSIKTDRGTSYEMYVGVLDEVKRAYHELRASYLNMPLEMYLNLANAAPETLSRVQVAKLEEAKQMFPMQISEAEPTQVK